MKMKITVLESGSNNIARVVGANITASSTGNVEWAVQRAAEKYFKHHQQKQQIASIKRTSGNVSKSFWEVTFLPANRQSSIVNRK